MTELLFRDNPYLAETKATVVTVNDKNGIVLDRLAVGKIESKGKQNRRVRIRFADQPA